MQIVSYHNISKGDYFMKYYSLFYRAKKKEKKTYIVHIIKLLSVEFCLESDNC